MKTSAIAVLAGLFAAAGCSSSQNGATLGGGPLNGGVGTAPSGYTAVYDASTSTLTVSDGSQTIPLPADITSPANAAGFATHYLGTGAANDDNYAFVATTAAGGYVAAATSGTADLGQAYTFHQGGQTPTSGTTATFNGRYAALLIDPTSASGSSTAVQGTATLNANFTSNTINGSITNRVSANGTTDAYADVTLSPTSIASFSFSGATTGGSRTNAGSPGDLTTAANGSYGGVFDGSGAEQVIGGVSLLHTRAGGGTLAEAGAFLATR